MADQAIPEVKHPIKDDFYFPRNFAKSAVYPLWQTVSRASVAYTNEQITNLLKEPFKSYKKLRDVSNYLYATCPAYVLQIDYFANLLAFDYVVFPDSVETNKKTSRNRFMEAAKKVRDANLREIKSIMLARTFVNGSTFWYDLSDNQNTIFVEIDSKLCRMAMIDNDNLWRYFVDLALLTNDKAYEYPEEIQEAYAEWITGGKKRNKEIRLIEGQNIELPRNYHLVSKRGFCMNAHIEKVDNDYPLFSPMFKDFNTMEENKTYLNETLKADAVKLIHLKIPCDDQGIPMMDKDIVDIYYQTAKEGVPANVLPLVDPFEVDSIAMDKSQQNQTNLVEHSQKVVSNDTGVSTTIFSAETTNGLAYSTSKDVAKMIPYLYYFTCLINYKIKEFKMKVKFLPIGFKDRADTHKEYMSDLPLGGSRMLWLATNGLEIYDSINLLEFEKAIDIDSLLPVKLSSNQMNASEESGRPATPEGQKADETVKGDKNK